VRLLRIGLLGLAVLTASYACTEKKDRPPWDSAESNTNTVDTAMPAGAVPDTSKSDSLDMPKSVSPTTGSDVLPPSRAGGSYTGETRRETPIHEDPPPNVIGETRKSGGTMRPLPPRDSTFGPKAGVDQKGQIVPIKRD
jgi:hypothetical protein